MQTEAKQSMIVSGSYAFLKNVNRSKTIYDSKWLLCIFEKCKFKKHKNDFLV
ncbi:hypothetical protein ACXYRG_02515 [Staphylococcus epidermidis]